MTIQDFKRNFDPILAEIISVDAEKYQSRCSDSFLKRTLEHVQVLALQGGKRVRPYMACMAYQMLGGRVTSRVMKLFCALEIFHLFALIHDDIIDRGDERHGVSSLHKYIEAMLGKADRLGDASHVASAEAMLLGDFLQGCAYYLMMKEWPFERKRMERVRKHFHAMVQEVILGESLDVDLATRPTTSSDLIDIKMSLKTASYTFIRPMKMGGALAGARVSWEGFCDEFGEAIGLAFQIQDDLLDLTASQKVIQKNVFSDLRERQHTIFTQYIFEHGSKDQQEELEEMIGSDLCKKDGPRIIKLFETTGAIKHGRKVMTGYFDKAEEVLQDLDFSKKSKIPLMNLITYIRSRGF